jgi:AraC-like DNA-binding protein
MTVLVDTATVAPAERPELWADAHARIFFPLAIELTGTPAFTGRVLGHAVGPLSIHRIAGDASVVRRTRTRISDFDPERVLVSLLLRGRCVVEQGDRSVVLDSGELSSWESSHPFAVRALEPFDLLVVGVPHALLGPRLDAVCRRTAGRIPGDVGIGAIAGPFFRALWDAVDGDTAPLGRDDLADGALALARALHAPEPGSGAPPAPGPTLVAHMKAWIEEHLGDDDLGPEAIARAHHVSTRYLQKLFAAEGVSVSAWVRHRRLERCRRDLRDPALADERISSIACRWGLANHAHFSRAFRGAYGCSPRELRAGPV